MNTNKKMTDKHETSEPLQKKAAHASPNAFFNVRSDVKVGFELNATVDFDKIAQSAKGMANSVKSIYNDGI